MPLKKTLHALIQTQLSRRQFIAYGSVLGISTLVPKLSLATTSLSTDSVGLGFTSIALGLAQDIQVAEGYQPQVLVRWGDPLTVDGPAFTAGQSTAAAQQQQFGYNNDFIAFMPLPRGSQNSDRGLLCVNHEYPSPNLMFAEYVRSKEQVDVQMAAVGHSIVEVSKTAAGQWEINRESVYNRRISALNTVCAISGPARGDARMRTSADPKGEEVIGTFGNCGGGKTPWGTVLSAEENIDDYFSGKASGSEKENHRRMGIKATSSHSWSGHHARFDVASEPHEPNRFGWVVEIDPYDPEHKPVKRTALGRFKHEAANCSLAKDGRVVVYMGDDEAFEYLYKFVTKGAYDAGDRKANVDLLDEGTLYVAKFSDTQVQWLPLIYGQGQLNDANGFTSQADVVIEARRAADLLNATPMDRPEDVQTNPVNGNVYVCLTNNIKRVTVNAPNPRPMNQYGHIVELVPEGGDHGAITSGWSVFLLAGSDGEGGEDDESPVKKHGVVFANPDNIAFDNVGNMWVATDGMEKTIGMADGLYAIACQGEQRGMARRFLNVPEGAELCGPEFTPDGTTLFVAVQHPAEGTGYDKPGTRWPDFDKAIPPRPSVVAITRRDGRVVGS